MDILGQYEKQQPQVIQAAPQRQLAPEYGFFIRLVIRLSGGRIQDSRRAVYVLLGIAAVFMLASLLFLFGVPGLSAPTRPNLINP